MMASPDLSAIFYLLSASLSAQEQTRKDAEAQLEQASASVGFAPLLLQIAASKDSQTDAAVKQAAAIYFKNLVSRRYDPYEESKVPALDEQDKNSIQGMLVKAVTDPQLIAATHKIIRADFPKRWPRLLEELHPLITSGDCERVISSLAIFHEVVSWHGGTATDGTREIIHGSFFSLLLAIAEARIGSAAALDKNSMAIVKSVLKSFYAAIQYRFSVHLLEGDAFTKWCAVVTHIIQLPVPAEIRALSVEEAEAHVYWKMKKWCLRIHNKIFQRYGCSKLDSFNNPDHPSFAKFYMEHVALHIFNVYMGQIQLSVEGQNPFPDRLFCLICDYMESCLRHKKTWDHLNRHAMNLVTHFIFPRLCFTEEDQETWENDPEEYVRVKLDPFDEIYSPQSAGVSFILDLVKCRKKATFIPVLQFINTTLSTATDRSKDGALFLLGSMSRVLLSSDFKSQLEPVISSFVIPELKSVQGFLRMRACWTLEQFDETEYTANTCIAAVQGVLNCLTDQELPVKVAAAGALGALLDNDTTQKFLPAYLAKVMEALLSLANQIQLDSIAFVLERLVQMFADDLSPYALQLCVQLRDTVARNLEGYSNVLDFDTDNDNFAQNTDKMMAVVGMFKTIETLIESMGKTPELVAGMEEIVVPLVAMVLDRRIIDVYEEVFELIDSITFSRKQISPSLWNLFPYIYRAFKDVGSDYIENMQTTLDNMITYGSAALLSNTTYLQMMLDIVKTTMTEESFGMQDREYGAKLIESLMLNCRGCIDGCIPSFIDYVLPLLGNNNNNNSEEGEDLCLSNLVSYLEVIINALYYNPSMTLAHLETRQATRLFFTLWFNKIGKFTRVHDKRLIIVSISQIMTSTTLAQLPPFLQQHWQGLLPIYLDAVQTLPKALEKRRQLIEEGEEAEDDDSSSYSDSDDSDYEDDLTEGAENDEAEEQRAIRKSTRAVKYEDFEEGKAKGREGDGEGEEGEEEVEEEYEEELEEELFFETPLDTLDLASVVQQSLLTLAQTQPQAFQAMVAALNEEQAKMLQSIVQQQ